MWSWLWLNGVRSLKGIHSWCFLQGLRLQCVCVYLCACVCVRARRQLVLYDLNLSVGDWRRKSAERLVLARTITHRWYSGEISHSTTEIFIHPHQAGENTPSRPWRPSLCAEISKRVAFGILLSPSEEQALNKSHNNYLLQYPPRLFMCEVVQKFKISSEVASSLPGFCPKFDSKTITWCL